MGIVNQKDIKQLTRTDPIFASINEKYGHPPDWTRPQGFVSLSKIILEQQVSLASASKTSCMALARANLKHNHGRKR
jgi:DNA-3-methyladenine glycosylase II